MKFRPYNFLCTFWQDGCVGNIFRPHPILKNLILLCIPTSRSAEKQQWGPRLPPTADTVGEAQLKNWNWFHSSGFEDFDLTGAAACPKEPVGLRPWVPNEMAEMFIAYIWLSSLLRSLSLLQADIGRQKNRLVNLYLNILTTMNFATKLG